MEFITDSEQDAIERQNRARLAANMRKLADFIESSNAPVGAYDNCYVYHCGETLDEARSLMDRSPGSWEKNSSGSSFNYTKTFGTVVPERGSYPVNAATYDISIPKSKTCERVQVDTRHVEAHDEPVYEWKCSPDTLA